MRKHQWLRRAWMSRYLINETNLSLIDFKTIFCKVQVVFIGNIASVSYERFPKEIFNFSNVLAPINQLEFCFLFPNLKYQADAARRVDIKQDTYWLILDR